MQSLYTVFINGTMYYYLGDFSKEICDKIDEIAVGYHTQSDNDEDICRDFIDVVSTKLNITLTKVSINRVFRLMT